jgi:GTP-binding protein HflX
LLLHIADASNPRVGDQISAVYEVLRELGIEEKDTLLVLNKVDQVNNLATLDAMINRYPNAVPVSAKTKLGFEKLQSIVSDALSRSFQDVDIEMHVSNGKLLAFIAANGEILATQYSEDNVKVHCRIPQKYLGRIDPTDTIITPHCGAGWISIETETAESEIIEETSRSTDSPNGHAVETSIDTNGAAVSADDRTDRAPAENVDVSAVLRPKQPDGAIVTPILPPGTTVSVDAKLPLDDG